jgi:hypothetical protein
VPSENSSLLPAVAWMRLARESITSPNPSPAPSLTISTWRSLGAARISSLPLSLSLCERATGRLQVSPIGHRVSSRLTLSTDSLSLPLSPSKANAESCHRNPSGSFASPSGTGSGMSVGSVTTSVTAAAPVPPPRKLTTKSLVKWCVPKSQTLFDEAYVSVSGVCTERERERERLREVVTERQ